MIDHLKDDNYQQLGDTSISCWRCFSRPNNFLLKSFEMRLRLSVTCCNRNFTCLSSLMRLPKNCCFRATCTLHSAWSLICQQCDRHLRQSNNHDSFPTVMMETELCGKSLSGFCCEVCHRFLLQFNEGNVVQCHTIKWIIFPINLTHSGYHFLSLVSQQTELSNIAKPASFSDHTTNDSSFCVMKHS